MHALHNNDFFPFKFDNQDNLHISNSLGFNGKVNTSNIWEQRINRKTVSQMHNNQWAGNTSNCIAKYVIYFVQSGVVNQLFKRNNP